MSSTSLKALYNEVGEAIERYADERGISLRLLAISAGMSPATFTRIMKCRKAAGEPPPMRMDALLRLASTVADRQTLDRWLAMAVGADSLPSEKALIRLAVDYGLTRQQRERISLAGEVLLDDAAYVEAVTYFRDLQRRFKNSDKPLLFAVICTSAPVAVSDSAAQAAFNAFLDFFKSCNVLYALVLPFPRDTTDEVSLERQLVSSGLNAHFETIRNGAIRLIQKMYEKCGDAARQRVALFHLKTGSIASCPPLADPAFRITFLREPVEADVWHDTVGVWLGKGSGGSAQWRQIVARPELWTSYLWDILQCFSVSVTKDAGSLKWRFSEPAKTPIWTYQRLQSETDRSAPSF